MTEPLCVLDDLTKAPAPHEGGRVRDLGVVEVTDVVDCKLPVAVDDPLLDSADDLRVAGADDDVDAHAADVTKVVVEIGRFQVQGLRQELLD